MSSHLGDVLLDLTDACPINYEILGNTEPALRAHVFPRYMDEFEKMRSRPVWLYEKDYRKQFPFDPERDAPFMAALRSKLEDAGICIE